MPLNEVLAAFAAHGVEPNGEIVRVAAHEVKPGVTSDEGAGDA